MAYVNHSQDGFTVIYNRISQSHDLTYAEKGLLVHLLSLPSDEHWNLSARGLAEIVPDGRDKINALLKSLIAKGYLIKNQIRDARTGQYTINAFEVFDTPQTRPDSGYSPCTENPSTVSPSTENPAEKNKNNKKINNNNHSSPCNYSALEANCDDDLSIPSTPEEIEAVITAIDDADSPLSSDNKRFLAEKLADYMHRHKISSPGAYIRAAVDDFRAHRKATPAAINKPYRPGLLDLKERNNYDFDRLEQMLLDYSAPQPEGG